MSKPIHGPDIVPILNSIRSGISSLERLVLNTPRPSARVYNSATISTTSGAFTALTFNTERWDTDEIHSTSSNTGRLTCVTPGIYSITGHVLWAANATGQRIVQIRLNGSTYIGGGDRRMAATGGALTAQNAVTTHRLAAGDYVELVALQESGGALNVATPGANDPMSPEFSMTWISP
jgi:hypothetical protein